MKIATLVVGRLQANCYIIGCEETNAAVIIDPGEDADTIIDCFRSNHYTLKYIINTHGHMDHVSANDAVQTALGGRLAIHKDDLKMLGEPFGNQSPVKESDIGKENMPLILQDADRLLFGNQVIEIIHTPGHTPGGICLRIGNSLFSGDTLFTGSVGRWDFPGGSYENLMHSLKSKILGLDDAIHVHPGHGPQTTIGIEKKYNPFLQ